MSRCGPDRGPPGRASSARQGDPAAGITGSIPTGMAERARQGRRRRERREGAERRLRRLRQRDVDRPGQCQPGRQGHRHPAAQGLARRPAEGRRRGAPTSRCSSPLPPRATIRRCGRCWPTCAPSARRRPTRRCRRQLAEAQHDRSARADPPQAAGRLGLAVPPAAGASPSCTTAAGRRRQAYQETKGLTVDGVIGGEDHARSTPRSTTASSR